MYLRRTSDVFVASLDECGSEFRCPSPLFLAGSCTADSRPRTRVRLCIASSETRSRVSSLTFRDRCCARGSTGQSRLIVKLTARTRQIVGRTPCFQRVGLRTASYSAPAVPRMPSHLHDSDAQACRVVHGGGIRSNSYRRRQHCSIANLAV